MIGRKIDAIASCHTKTQRRHKLLPWPKKIETAKNRDRKNTVWCAQSRAQGKLTFSGCALSADRSWSSAVSHNRTASYRRHDSRLSQLFFGQGNKSRANRGGAPQASHAHTRRTQLRSSLPRLLTPTLQRMLSARHTLALRARLTLQFACVSKKVNISWGQRLVEACKTNVQIYTHIDIRAHFDPKGTTCKARVHTGATFGHPRCWWFTNSRFSTKRSFHHQSKRNLKTKVSKSKKKTWTSSEICE